MTREREQTEPQNGCSKKHLQLSCWIIGVLLTVCIGVSVAIGNSYSREAQQAKTDTAKLREEMDPRIRAAEQERAAVTVKLDQMQKTLDRLEKKLDERN